MLAKKNSKNLICSTLRCIFFRIFWTTLSLFKRLKITFKDFSFLIRCILHEFLFIGISRFIFRCLKLHRRLFWAHRWIITRPTSTSITTTRFIFIIFFSFTLFIFTTCITTIIIIFTITTWIITRIFIRLKAWTVVFTRWSKGAFIITVTFRFIRFFFWFRLRFITARLWSFSLLCFTLLLLFILLFNVNTIFGSVCWLP